MNDKSQDAVRLLRAVADAIEKDRSEFVSYELNDTIQPHNPRETRISIDVADFEVGSLINESEELQ